MDYELDPPTRELRERARRFVREVLQPRELELERLGGRLPAEVGRELRKAAIEACRSSRAGRAGRPSSRSPSTSSSAR